MSAPQRRAKTAQPSRINKRLTASGALHVLESDRRFPTSVLFCSITSLVHCLLQCDADNKTPQSHGQLLRVLAELEGSRHALHTPTQRATSLIHVRNTRAAMARTLTSVRAARHSLATLPAARHLLHVARDIVPNLMPANALPAAPGTAHGGGQQKQPHIAVQLPSVSRGPAPLTATARTLTSTRRTTDTRRSDRCATRLAGAHTAAQRCTASCTWVARDRSGRAEG